MGVSGYPRRGDLQIITSTSAGYIPQRVGCCCGEPGSIDLEGPDGSWITEYRMSAALKQAD